MNIRQWWAEMMRPSLKCRRVGHRLNDEKRRVYLYPSTAIISRAYVATQAIEITPACSRCGHREETRIEDEQHLTGFSTTSDRMRTLRKTGKLYA